MTNNSAQEKPLRTVSFIVHATRGVIRDHKTRRKTMLILVVAALVLLLSGSTFLQAALNPRAHPGWFILFWLTCAWLTLTAMLLAIFDLLIVKLESRKTQRLLQQGLKRPSAGSTPGK
jgi:hypothetical protein